VKLEVEVDYRSFLGLLDMQKSFFSFFLPEIKTKLPDFCKFDTTQLAGLSGSGPFRRR
jgi:hypothetical protein